MTYPPLDREEYIEQTYFFRVYRERLEQNVATQDILLGIHEEILSTTRLPMAIDFLPGKWIDAVQKILEEIQLPLNGKISELGLTSYRPVVHLQNCKLSGN